jgi:hypothetical protein
VFTIKFAAGDAELLGPRLTIPVGFRFKALSEKEHSEVIAITCQLRVEYELADGYNPSPEEVTAFKDGNAIFNCWGYLREYVQNTVARMNFPPVALPFLRLAPKPTSAVVAGDSMAAASHTQPALPSPQQQALPSPDVGPKRQQKQQRRSARKTMP